MPLVFSAGSEAKANTTIGRSDGVCLKFQTTLVTIGSFQIGSDQIYGILNLYSLR